MSQAARPALHTDDDGQPGQPDLFGKHEGRPAPYRPDPEGVRGRLAEILAELQEVKKPPLDGASLYRAVIPSLVKWLPDEEGAKFENDLMREMKRLKADKPQKPKPRMTQAEYDALTA